MNKSCRLTHSEDIKQVRQEGQSLAHRVLVLVYLANNLEYNRIAVIAGRSVGGAVQRNLAKRRIRSAYQHFQVELSQGFDIAIIARAPILKIGYSTLLDALRSLFTKASLLKV